MKYTVVIYTDTTSRDAVSDYMDQRSKHKKEQARKRRFWYFLKQRLTGIFLLAITVPAVAVMDGDATMALVTVPLGLCLLFTKEKLIMDRYY